MEQKRQPAEDNIRCHHDTFADIRFQDGALPHVMGACSYQVVRACRDPKLSQEGRGFTYNHAPMLVWWNGHFLYEYLGGEKSEHIPPTAVFLCISKDGVHWNKPTEIFPSIEVPAVPYRGPSGEYVKGERIPAIVHHRMGFYTTAAGRLLVSTFYGISPEPHTNPNNGYGVGRVVREIYSDFSLSDICFIRYNEAGGYGRQQVNVFGWYEESKDMGFVEACRELLGNRLVTQQWWEEERLDEAFFTRPGGSALSFYTLNSGRVMGVFKNSMTSWTDDKGEHWSPLERSPSIITSTGKVWGQRTPDQRFALVYNPSPDGAHRWPLAVTTGDNGTDFYGLGALLPEISPCRYEGGMKNLGAQYVRGIAECNKAPEEQAVWIAYSVNKEDLWITRFPVSVKMTQESAVCDDMSLMTEKQLRETWNLYVPAWGGAELIKHENTGALKLCDWDPYNRVRAERLFQQLEKVRIKVRIQISRLSRDKITLLVQDQKGQNALILVLKPDGKACINAGGVDQPVCVYRMGQVLEVDILIRCRDFTYTVRVSEAGDAAGLEMESTRLNIIGEKSGLLGACVKNVERFVMTSKYNLPFQSLEVNGKAGNIGDLKDADIPHEPIRFAILFFQAEAGLEL